MPIGRRLRRDRRANEGCKSGREDSLTHYRTQGGGLSAAGHGQKQGLSTKVAQSGPEEEAIVDVAAAVVVNGCGST